MTKNCFKEKPIEELVTRDGSMISGDRPEGGTSEIETGPYDKHDDDDSDYEKGVPPTPDRVSRYRQKLPMYAAYRSVGSRVNERRIMTKQNVEEESDGLVKKRDVSDLVDTSKSSRVKRIINLIDILDLTTDDIENIKQALIDKTPVDNKSIND